MATKMDDPDGGQVNQPAEGHPESGTSPGRLVNERTTQGGTEKQNETQKDLVDGTIPRDDDAYLDRTRLLVVTAGLMAVVLMVALDNYILGLLKPNLKCGPLH